MADLKARLAELEQACADPRARLEHYLSQGKKVVGCFAVYTPEELVHASGMIPMGIWGAQTEVKLAKRFLPAFACPIMQSSLELGLRGSYRGLSAVLIPTLCDTFRCISQDWRFGVKDIPMIPVTYPQNRKIAAAEDFLISEFDTVLSRLSILTGNMMTDDALENSIRVYNEHSQAMTQFCKVANDHLDIITPTVRHAVMKSAFFYEKSEHTAIVREIVEGLNELPRHQFKGKRVILSGITAEPTELLKILEENDMAVVGDDLAQETRQYRTLIPTKGGTPIRRLARQWMDRKACCLAHEDFKQRGEMLVEMAQAEKATGALYCLMKFCDPEEYDYPICRSALQDAGIPTLLLEIDQQSTSCEQARTRIQSFADMI